MSGLYWIDLLSDYRRGEGERCVEACSKAHFDGASWSCPIFALGVDRCSVMSRDGKMCRLFERKETE